MSQTRITGHPSNYSQIMQIVFKSHDYIVISDI